MLMEIRPGGLPRRPIRFNNLPSRLFLRVCTQLPLYGRHTVVFNPPQGRLRLTLLDKFILLDRLIPTDPCFLLDTLIPPGTPIHLSQPPTANKPQCLIQPTFTVVALQTTPVSNARRPRERLAGAMLLTLQ